MRRLWAALLLAVASVVAVTLATLYVQGSADLTAQDQQPIAFSHAVHAGDLQIDCRYCHRHVDISPVAGIPSMELCLTCHQGMNNDSPESRKLMTYWTEQRPVEWVRLQRLPDFVYFTHEMHTGAGLRCADCHGSVERMSQTPRAPTYEMGWCLTCHEQRSAPDDCWACHK